MASQTYTLTFSNLIGEFTTDQKSPLGSQDPYVVFQAGGSKAQTKAIKGVGAGTAEWKETYTLESFAPNSSTLLEVVVYNHNTLRPDSIIGSGSVDLSQMGESKLSGSGESISVPLTSKKGDNVGNLSFVVNGGGFNGSSTGSGNAGYNTGSAGYGAAGGATGAGISSGRRGINAGEDDVVGVGAGTDKHSAKEAAKEAAREGQDVAIDTDTGAGAGRPVANQGANTGYSSGKTAAGAGEYAPGEVIDRKYYTGVEERPQDQALVEQYREHNPYAKEYETTVQHTGRERQVGSNIEALGTSERVIGSDHIVHGQPHAEIARNLPEGALNERPGGPGWVETKPGPICDSNTFTITGDRPVDKERVTDLKEHRDFEKEFEVKTQLKDVRNTGEGVAPEMLNRERVLVDEKPKNACEGHPDAATAGADTGYGTTGSATQAGYGSQATNANTGYGTPGVNNSSTY